MTREAAEELWRAINAFRAAIGVDHDPIAARAIEDGIQWLRANTDVLIAARAAAQGARGPFEVLWALALGMRPAAEALPHDLALLTTGHFLLGPPVEADMAASHSAAEIWLAMVRHHQYGKATVALRAGQAASLAMTDIPSTMAADLRAPWPGFVIVVPPGELTVQLNETLGVTHHGQQLVAAPAGAIGLRNIWVTSYAGARYATKESRAFGYHDGQWNVHLTLDNGVELHAGVRSIEELISNCDIDPIATHINETTDCEKRAIRIASRIALSVMLWIVAHGKSRRGHAASGKKGARRRWSIAGAHEDWVIAAPVVIGLEEEINDYLRGETDQTRKTRWVTRGHWRSQPYGPQAQLRRPMWIAPHWNSRGPERLRSYVLGTDPETGPNEKI